MPSNDEALLAILLLKQEDAIHLVAPVLVELGLYDATVLDGEGAENYAERAVPLLAEAGRLLNAGMAYHRVVVMRAESRDQLRELERLCRRTGVDLADPDTGMLAWFPVRCAGSAPPGEPPDREEPGS